MNALTLCAAGLAAALFVYLVIALIRPENFS